MSKTLKALKWIGAFAAISVLVLFLFWTPIVRFVFHELPFMGHSFDGLLWSSALNCSGDRDCLDKEFACVRGPMYRDLEKNKLQIGVSEMSVIDLIGRPTRVGKANCIDYELGYCSGLKIDMDYLRICFDDTRRISRVSHWQS